MKKNDLQIQIDDAGKSREETAQRYQAYVDKLNKNTKKGETE